MKKVSLLIGILVVVIVGWYFVSQMNQSSTETTTGSNVTENEVEEVEVKGNTDVAITDLEDQYDVIVVGGEPEGVAAAVSAARNGANTLLIERRDGLGGLMTFGMLNYIDMVQGIGNENAIGGVFNEWHALIGGGNAFGIQLAKDAFLKLVEDEENITLALDTTTEDVLLAEDGKTVVGLELHQNEESKVVNGSRVIDATQDGDIAVLAGAPYYIGGEDINLKDRLMAVTLMIHLHDVDWDGVREAVSDEVFGHADITDSVAWGFNDLHYVYEPKEENTRLRGLNLVQIENAEEKNDYYINALQIFGVDGLDEDAIAEAIEKGKRETDHILEYLQAEFPGFENAKIASYPDELYIRETRHVKSEYMLPMSDVWTNRDHWDGIGMGGYPVDVQAQSVNDFGYVLSSPIQYAVPFRSTVPLEVENLIVVSRSAGYSSLAAGSARIIPTGMAVAEAGGLAAVLSIENDKTFREFSQDEERIEELRVKLTEQDAKVDAFDLEYSYQGEWFDESIQLLIDYGLVVAGYDNDLRVEEELLAPRFNNMILNGTFRMNEEFYQDRYEAMRDWSNMPNYQEAYVTRDEVAQYVMSVFAEEEHTLEESFELAYEKGYVDDTLYNELNEDRTLNNAEGYYWAAYLLENFVLNN